MGWIVFAFGWLCGAASITVLACVIAGNRAKREFWENNSL